MMDGNIEAERQNVLEYDGHGVSRPNDRRGNDTEQDVGSVATERQGKTVDGQGIEGERGGRVEGAEQDAVTVWAERDTGPEVGLETVERRGSRADTKGREVEFKVGPETEEGRNLGSEEGTESRDREEEGRAERRKRNEKKQDRTSGSEEMLN